MQQSRAGGIRQSAPYPRRRGGAVADVPAQRHSTFSCEVFAQVVADGRLHHLVVHQTVGRSRLAAFVRCHHAEVVAACSRGRQHSDVRCLGERLKQRAAVKYLSLDNRALLRRGRGFNVHVGEHSLFLRTYIEVRRLAGRLRDACRRLVQREPLAEVPDETPVVGHGPMAAAAVREEPHLAAVRTARPFFQVAVIPAGPIDGLRVVGVLVVLSVVLYVGVYAILLVAERAVVVGDTLQQVHGLLTIVPGFLRELYAAGGCEGRNLILHVGYAMVDEHRAH